MLATVLPLSALVSVYTQTMFRVFAPETEISTSPFWEAWWRWIQRLLCIWLFVWYSAGLPYRRRRLLDLLSSKARTKQTAMPAYQAASQKDDIYQMVGCNNRNHLVQSKRLLPFHEDITKVDAFDQTSVAPGQWTRIKLDMKHASDRELILNDIRLQFELRFGRAATGQVFAVRGTDLIRQMVVKINEDIIFKVDKRGELSHLWLMGNHKADGDSYAARQSYLLNQGNLPQGDAPPLYYNTSDKNWYTGKTTTTSGTPPVTTTTYADAAGWTQARMTACTHQRHDGRPRLIYDDSSNPIYVFPFDISLNQVCGPILARLHVRRIEYINIELMFEPFVSKEDTQEFLLFKTNPTVNNLVHPYQNATYQNVKIRQYRTTVLDGTGGFTLPDTRMLSWMIRRYSMKEYSFNFTNSTEISIPLKDWEIRTNITRLYWQVKPTTTLDRSTHNAFIPSFPPNNFDSLFGVEIWWKNDKVLDLDSTFQVYRHYVLAENKRYGLMNPFIRFYRLEAPYPNGVADHNLVNYNWDNINTSVLTDGSSVASTTVTPLFEAGLYMIDFHMNVLAGVPGADIIDGIVNDTSDYVIKLKRVSDRSSFQNSGNQTLQVFLEYQTLVNLAASSNQFNRSSQMVTKQLNMQ